MEGKTIGLIADLANSAFSAYASYKKGNAAIESDEYRADLATENAMRADLLYLDREVQARREGMIDASAFSIRAKLSGLSGASLSMWVGQRYMDNYKSVVNARTTREQTVNRFMKEAKWHRGNQASSRTNRNLEMAAAGATALGGIAKGLKEYNRSDKQPKQPK